MERGRERLRQEEEELRRRLAAFEGDDVELERAARMELGYIRPGEVEYRFPKPEPR